MRGSSARSSAESSFLLQTDLSIQSLRYLVNARPVTAGELLGAVRGTGVEHEDLVVEAQSPHEESAQQLLEAGAGVEGGDDGRGFQEAQLTAAPIPLRARRPENSALDKTAFWSGARQGANGGSEAWQANGPHRSLSRC